MANAIKLTFLCEQKSSGEVSGKGTISFKLALTDLSFGVDYRKEDKLILQLTATQGLHICTNGTLTFSGEINSDLMNRVWDGSVKIQLEISKKCAASLKHTFSPQKKAVRFDLKFDI